MKTTNNELAKKREVKTSVIKLIGIGTITALTACVTEADEPFPSDPCPSYDEIHSQFFTGCEVDPELTCFYEREYNCPAVASALEEFVYQCIDGYWQQTHNVIPDCPSTTEQCPGEPPVADSFCDEMSGLFCYYELESDCPDGSTGVLPISFTCMNGSWAQTLYADPNCAVSSMNDIAQRK